MNAKQWYQRRYPFADSSSTPNPSPFFPAYTAPPPPPSPVSFTSFPANISSLDLPHSSSAKSSSKLVAATVAAVISAVLVVGIAVFCYCRRRRTSDFSDDKTFRSDNSNRHGAAIVDASGRTQKFRTSSTSSEFLYLGTLVNSRGIDDDRDDNHRNGEPAAAVSAPRKVDSPDLRPLPPLSRQSNKSSRRNCGNGDASSTAEEEEEFYSPRVSLDGRESDGGAGSGSTRAFDTIAAENFEARSSNSSSTSSSSSSSPARSHSISLSPPVSLSPRRSQPKSVESVTTQAPPPPRPRIWTAYVVDKAYSSSSSPPHTESETSPDGSPRKYLPSPSLSPAILSAAPNLDTSLRLWNAPGRNVHSPTLSMTSSSPDRSSEGNPETPPRVSVVSEKNPDGSLRIWNHWVQNEPSPSSSLPSTSPARSLGRNPDASPRRSNASSSLASSPDASPRVSNVVVQNLQSPARMSNASQKPFSAPARSTERNPVSSSSSASSSPRISNVMVQNLQSPARMSKPFSAPARSLYSSSSSASSSPRVSNVMVQNLQSPARMSNASQKPFSAQAPPPPPPPPLPPQRYWEAPNPQLNSKPKPPPLTPPSRPFMLQNTELPPIQPPQPSFETMEKTEKETPKPKLKPLHWDKVRASSDREMVWDHLRSSSFKLNEEMIESLFIVNTPQSKPKETTPRSVLPSPNKDNRVLDPKKSQNIAIALRALNVTVDEVCEALLEGNAETLGTEVLESLLKMAPNKEEERKLKEFKEDSPVKLGPAEKFLKAVLDVPFAFRRIEAMLYMTNFETEVEYLKKSFETLESACEELRNSRLFLKLLEAVLKTGNRMNVGTNRGDAHAFKLDTLLKLADIKGADNKTTLLHFVVQEITRTEGARLSGTTQAPTTEDAKCRKQGLAVVSSLSSELASVKKSAAMDSDSLSNDVSKLSRGLKDIEDVLNALNLKDTNGSRFYESLNGFITMAEEEIIRVQAQESVALSLVKEITEYFHGNSAKEEAHPFRIFTVVRDFLNVLDRVCREVGMINERTVVSSAHKFPVPVNPLMAAAAQVGFPGRRQCSSSDDEGSTT